jgi:magnesium-transporting ATPase (P-type)
MGQAGSDVAKEASDIILTDDNFASITNAIKEGRRMFDNIQKYVLHVLAENIAQAGTLLIGLVFKDRNGISVFALSPVQVLWVIVATSGMPDMGLGFEKAQPNIMVRPPQSVSKIIQANPSMEGLKLTLISSHLSSKPVSSPWKFFLTWLFMVSGLRPYVSPVSPLLYSDLGTAIWE